MEGPISDDELRELRLRIADANDDVYRRRYGVSEHVTLMLDLLNAIERGRAPIRPYGAAVPYFKRMFGQRR